MSRIQKYLWVNIIVLLFISCSEDFLNRENPSTLSMDNFYKSNEDFEIAMAGVYNVLLRADYYNMVITYYLEIASDDAQPGDDADFNNLIGNQVDNFLMTPESFTSVNIFLSSYVGIARANIVLSRIKESSLEQGFKEQIEAESRFLRALFYFNLVRLYGDVPLFLKEITNNEEIFIPRTPIDKVYADCIIPDLEYAGAKLPGERNAEGIARATKWAAKALLAKAYLTMTSMNNDKSGFQKSRDLSFDIIKNGPFMLEEKFSDLFRRDREFGKESILEINYVSTQYYYKYEGIGSGVYIPQRNGLGSYYNLWYSPRFQGGVAGAWSFQGYGITVPTTSNDNRGNGIYAVPSGTGLVDAYEAGDLRKKSTILDYYAVGDSLYKLNLISKNVDRNLSPFNIKKYDDFTESDNGESDDNFFLLRLADIYLMFAEAENEINNGPTSDAYEYLNKIRRRAFGKNIYSPSAIDYKNLAYKDFLSKVYHERRLELAYEGHRFFDLIRRPEIALQILKAQGKINVTKDRLLLPIPQYVMNEMNAKSKVFTQNSGY